MVPLLGVCFLIGGGEQQFFQRCEPRQAFLLQREYSLSQVLQWDEPTSGQEVSIGRISHLGSEDQIQPVESFQCKFNNIPSITIKFSSSLLVRFHMLSMLKLPTSNPNHYNVQLHFIWIRPLDFNNTRDNVNIVKLR